MILFRVNPSSAVSIGVASAAITVLAVIIRV
jgi:hypothetical protein